MALGINTNLASLSAQRALNNTQSDTASAMQRLSTGLRINSAKDDAAGMAVASRFTSQISGMQQASRNASDAVSMLQTAEGGLQSITDNLQRIRELSVQAASDSISATDRGFLNTEVSQLVSEINRVADTTKFNGNTLLNGDYATAASALTFQVGADNSTNDQMDVTIGDFNTAVVGTGVSDTSTVTTTAVTGFDNGLTVSVNGGTATAIAATNNTTTFDGSASYAATVASELNALTGVTASSSATTTVNMGTMTLTGTADAGDSATLTINGEAIAFSNTDLSGLTAATTKTVIDNYISTNSPTALANVTVSATGGSGSDLVITDSTGKQLSAAWSITDVTSAGVTNTLSGGTLSTTGSTQATSFSAGNFADVTGTVGAGTTPKLTVGYAFTADPSGTNAASSGTVDVSIPSGGLNAAGFATALQTALAGETNMSLVSVANAGGAITVAANGTNSDTIAITSISLNQGSIAASNAALTGAGATGQTKTDLGTISVTLAANTSLDFTNNVNSGLADSTGTTVTGAALSTISVVDQAQARTAISAVDNALKTVSEGRAELGAFQSRFESVIANLDLGAENAQAARSRVQDADFAVESANLAKNQVLQQAGMSVLAQANALPQQVLALLQ